MEKVYWTGRKRASLQLARDASNSQAKLVHYDMAGRYSLKAMSAESKPMDLVGALPPAIRVVGGKSGSEGSDDA